MLERVQIASPCTADWELMAGDDRVRFCAHCSKRVYNLSAMTRRDVEQLLTATNARICTRFYRRLDGTILTEDCPMGLRAKAARLKRRVSLVFSGWLGLAGATFAQLPNEPKPLVQIDSRPVVAGVVKDQAGAVIGSADVVLLDPKTGKSVQVRSNDRGEFRIISPGSGSYTVKASRPGFEIFSKDITLKDKGDVTLEIMLLIAAMMGVIVTVEPRA
jgi:hypothetical protein